MIKAMLSNKVWICFWIILDFKNIYIHGKIWNHYRFINIFISKNIYLNHIFLSCWFVLHTFKEDLKIEDLEFENKICTAVRLITASMVLIVIVFICALRRRWVLFFKSKFTRVFMNMYITVLCIWCCIESYAFCFVVVFKYIFLCLHLFL